MKFILKREELFIIVIPKIYRGEKMSTRSLDHCTCGHNRESHNNFDGECEECKCEVFHRGMRMKNMPAE